MTTANAACPLNLSPTTIAAWRDGALSSDEAARIAAHVSTCIACRSEIAVCESLDDALRRQPELRSDGRLWRDVRAGIIANRAPRRSRLMSRRMMGAMSALAAVLLLALGFAQLFHLYGAVRQYPASTTTTIQGTPTPLPTPVLPSLAVRGAAPMWQPGNFPTSGITFGEQSTDILSFGVASTDGAIAYACYSTTNQAGSQITLYRTSDRAAHWTRLLQSPQPQFQTSDCLIQVDATDANRVVVHIMGQTYQNLQEGQWNLLSEDGGTTWTKLSYTDLVYGVATAGNRTYAIRQQVVGQQSNGMPKIEQHLAASTDHLRSWQPIDRNLLASGQSVTQFWLNPDGGLLADVTGTTTDAQSRSTVTSRELLRSMDGGVHWSVFPTPNLGSDVKVGPDAVYLGTWTVRQPTAHGQPWQLCASELTNEGKSTVGLVCTFDSGRTWTVRPYLCTNVPCARGVSSGFTGFGATIATDGSILLIAPDKAVHLGLYRLPAHSSQWEYLGSVNGSNAFYYAPSSNGGVLWLYAGGDSLGHLSGVIGGHLGSLPSVLLYTAAFP